jgi:hypothetical protein
VIMTVAVAIASIHAHGLGSTVAGYTREQRKQGTTAHDHSTRKAFCVVGVSLPVAQLRPRASNGKAHAAVNE